jgi:DNA-binding MarR family transcriptional regulator
MVGGESCQPNDPTQHPLRGTAVWLLGRASLGAQQLTQERLASAGVRKWHYAVLATLADGGPAAQAEIGRRIGLDRSDMVAVLNDLQRDGYLSRSPDPADRRRNRVEVTRTGRSALKRFRRLIFEADDKLLEPLSPTDRQHLISLLERIVDASAEPPSE